MKTLQVKVAILFSFLIIMIPSGKLILPNGGILFVTIIQVFEYFPITGFHLDLSFDFLLALLALIGSILLFKNGKRMTLISIILQLIWLINLFNSNDFKFWYYTIPTSIYLIFCLILIYSLFVSKNPDSSDL